MSHAYTVDPVKGKASFGNPPILVFLLIRLESVVLHKGPDPWFFLHHLDLIFLPLYLVEEHHSARSFCVILEALSPRIVAGIPAGCAALCYWFIVKHPIEEKQV
jgi:hypothetical protein